MGRTCTEWANSGAAGTAWANCDVASVGAAWKEHCGCDKSPPAPVPCDYLDTFEGECGVYPEPVQMDLNGEWTCPVYGELIVFENRASLIAERIETTCPDIIPLQFRLVPFEEVRLLSANEAVFIAQGSGPVNDFIVLPNSQAKCGFVLERRYSVTWPDNWGVRVYDMEGNQLADDLDPTPFYGEVLVRINAPDVVIEDEAGDTVWSGQIDNTQGGDIIAIGAWEGSGGT